MSRSSASITLADGADRLAGERGRQVRAAWLSNKAFQLQQIKLRRGNVVNLLQAVSNFISHLFT